MANERATGISVVRMALALIFAAATVLYAVLWMAASRRVPEVELGFYDPYVPSEHAMVVASVVNNSPAEKAGVRPEDRVIAINGNRVNSVDYQTRIWRAHKPGDTVQLTIQRRGDKAPFVVTAVFRPRLEGRPGESVAEELIALYPVPFVVVGLAVLFLRLGDLRAWLLALLFASFVQTLGNTDAIAEMAPAFAPFAVAYKAIFQAMLGPLFYYLFAVFPTRSPLDRRVPWLKWVALALGIFFAIPGLSVGQMELPAPLAALLGPSLSRNITLLFVYGLVVLGFISVAVNFYRRPDPDARRKLRVIFWGSVIGVVPLAVTRGAQDFAGFRANFWLNTILVVVLTIFPLSLGYAVVKHRVLEIPVLLRRSARYVLVQRGFNFLLALLSVGLTLLFALSFARYLGPVLKAAQSSGIILGVVFGSALLWGGSEIHKRVSGRIDRAFFRSAYDARVILEDLAEKTRAAAGRAQLAELLEHHVEQALRPASLFIYFLGGDDRLTAASGSVPPGLSTIPVSLTMLAQLPERGQPWEFPQAGENAPAAKSPLAQLDPDCLVPLLGRGGRLVGLLVLGRRLSDEPYSREDRRLLGSVASQAATALENIRLAEEIAERMEAEGRVAREMEIAKEVQTRLLPQAPVHLKTLDCAARCIQARQVGGDYYDFLELGPDQAGFVLADVSGKGVHAALLMATLQAHLRSQSGIAPQDPARLLQQVNRLIYKSTSAEHYATLFYTVYDDCTRRLRYVNCGHNPPIRMHADGSVERLTATATVIGIFERWECSVGEVQLAPGDLLVVFSDGVTEAAMGQASGLSLATGDEEFGEARLIEVVRAARDLSASEIVNAILDSVQQFSQGGQSDDLTLLVARGL